MSKLQNCIPVVYIFEYFLLSFSNDKIAEEIRGITSPIVDEFD
jgi:hypothetical protein